MRVGRADRLCHIAANDAMVSLQIDLHVFFQMNWRGCPRIPHQVRARDRVLLHSFHFFLAGHMIISLYREKIHTDSNHSNGSNHSHPERRRKAVYLHDGNLSAGSSKHG